MPRTFWPRGAWLRGAWPSGAWLRGGLLLALACSLAGCDSGGGYAAKAGQWP
jgi:hypothetical protein